LDAVLDAVLDAERVRRGAPGLAACVLRAGQPTVLLASGEADLVSGRRVTCATTFAWYSLTKIVTAVTALRLAHAGRLDLDAPVVERVPELQLSDPARRRWQPVTARHLLCHRAGFADRQLHVARWFREPGAPWPDPSAFLAAALRRHGPRRAPPGAREAYSNLGYAVLGQLIASAAGCPFRAAVHELVLDPLGMTGTGFEGAERLRGDHARGHLPRWSGMGLAARLLGGGAFSEGRVGRHELVRWRDLVFSPHGGLLGPVGDLARLLSLFTGGDVEPEQASLLQVCRGMCDDEALAAGLRPGAAEQYGPGWCVLSPANGAPQLRHGGRGPGYTTEMLVSPREGLAVGLLGNGGFDARATAEALLAAARPAT